MRGAHFGEVIWANNPNVSTLDDDYYTGDAIKDDANVYAKYALTNNNILFYADAQYRFVNHIQQVAQQRDRQTLTARLTSLIQRWV